VSSNSGFVAFLFVGGVLCFYSWLLLKATRHPLPTLEKPLIFYSNQCRQDLKLMLCSALKKAHQSIDIQIYALTDRKIKQLLHRKEKEGIIPTIRYDASASHNLKKHFQHAIPVRTKGLMHRKIIVLDHSILFMGTANLTTQSLTMHDNLMLGLYHPPLAAFLQSPTSSSFPFTVGKRAGEAWCLPDPTHQALFSIIRMIDTAEKTIEVAMFTLTHPLLIDALCRAKERGVTVKVAVDFYTKRGASSKSIQVLEKAKVPVYTSRGFQLFHHKWALIDQKKLIIGSANWTKAAFERNADCFLILHSLSHSQKRFLKKLWKTIEIRGNIRQEILL
jgi:cardiolipin synthase A/B